MIGTFQLQRNTYRWARFARVAVQLAPATETSVVVGGDVFGWRRGEHGPGVQPSPWDDGRRVEAVSGVWYAWERLPDPRPPVRVVVREIVDSPVDTGPGDVKFAAAYALWDALGLTPPTVRPFLDAEGVPVFPSG